MSETTTTDWRTMEAGRELDALVAGRVMGATIHEGLYADYMTLPGERMISDQRPVPHYSADIAAAWRVLGTLHGNPDRWDAFMSALPDGLRAMHATALHELEESQAALAIARAALATQEAP